jgi:hypothetical protein
MCVGDHLVNNHFFLSYLATWLKAVRQSVSFPQKLNRSCLVLAEVFASWRSQSFRASDHNENMQQEESFWDCAS